jgi:TetR/AcrR family transcriptional repressor of nem operon
MKLARGVSYRMAPRRNPLRQFCSAPRDFLRTAPNSYYNHNMSQRQQQKTHTRKQILGSAVRHLKTEGLSGASVSDIMASAGLTVGGFYAHFPSKDALADEAVRHAMGERRRMFLDRFEGLDWTSRIGSALREYMTSAHRDDPANGCPLSMAAIEAAQNEATAIAFVEEFARFAEAFEAGKHSSGPSAPREAAIGTLALMVGGMILARAAKTTPLSDEILCAVDSYGQAALGHLARPSSRRGSKPQGGDH